MKQVDKQLLLKDLCGRLPYGVKVELMPITRGKCVKLTPIILADYFISDTTNYLPYLRPIEDMMEEEYVYFMSIRGMNLRSYEIKEMMSENFSHPNRIAIVNTLGRYSHNIDWLNENMFDYRGLIPMNLALEAPEGMYTKEK